MPIEKDHILLKTGVPGLDDVLAGGLTSNHIYLLEGTPGTGKTTLGLQFLIEGVKNGQSGLYVTLSETGKELEEIAASHGWSLKGIDIHQMTSAEEQLDLDNQFTMFHPSEVELNETTKNILNQFEQHKPTRVVFDSLSEIRLMAQSSLRYRRQVLALKQYFSERECTVLFLDSKSLGEHIGMELESTVHGVISLEQITPEYGAERRRLCVTKFRGRKYRGGYHDYVIKRGGLQVFPRLVAMDYRTGIETAKMKSGIDALDNLLGGGVETGSSVLAIGPAGAGKSTLALQYAVNAARQGDFATIFTFDERAKSILGRARGLGMDLESHIKSGHIDLVPVDPAELSPGEFVQRVRDTVEGDNGKPGASVVVIDSLNGYLQSMPEEMFLIPQLHELLTYLGHKRVVTFLVVAQHGLLGGDIETPVDTSYLADTVILFRFFEMNGCVRQAISVVKNRSGNHERAIREYSMCREGIVIGSPLINLHGILTGTPYPGGQESPRQESNGAVSAH